VTVVAYDRRLFLKSAGAAGLALAAAPAHAARALDPNSPAVLVDTTRCIGCRGCEAACAEANGLPEPPEPPGDIFATRREASTTQFTVVNRGSVASNGDERFAKTQCLHCLSPGCASACPVRALEKTPEGPVVYHADRCIGCRYCMVACPFGVPKYEYQKAVPYVRKCTFCYERQVRGLKPACVEACPAEALSFGTRSTLLLEAKRRVFAPDSGYVPHVYGEHESGGTSWLYISDVPLESLGLRTDVSDVAPSERTDGALSAVPVVMTLWPPLLMGLYAFAHERRDNDKEDDHV
jgi:Fe-S-cluster-containing dehydrogenase component